ncbi:MAG: metal-dependent transcriptional regulator [Fibrobacteria bacterium]|nr:metal-dependent transcriptional regulator [Fibrobacteria bacterium]
MKRKDIEECLEIIWHLEENHDVSIENFLEHDIDQFGEVAIQKLEQDSFIRISNNKISMTKTGEEMARQVVRRHRLAERLLTDVLGMKPDEIEAGACEFEHILASELVESICTLLGHPKLCPHGTTIPPGPCCQRKEKSVNSLTMPLTELPIKKEYKIAYINSESDLRIRKLFNFHIIPGSLVTVTQRYPAYIVHSGNTQIAIEEDIASDIFVWRNGEGERALSGGEK